MKSSVILGTILLAGFAVEASAISCSGAGAGYTTRLDDVQISSALSGKRILAKAPDDEEWNEDHCTNGNLYKVGTEAPPPKHPERPSVDRRAYRGTWAIIGTGSNAQVQYTYTVGGNSQFTWSLWSNDSGGLCWEDAGVVIATAPSPDSAGTPCD